MGIGMQRTSSDLTSGASLRERGVSLLEVIAVLAFLGILLSISVPTIATFSGRTYLRRETVAARLFLERAYAHALAFRQPITVTIENASLTTRSENGQLVERLSLRRKVLLRPESVRDGRILFYPSITASPATLRLTRGASQCSIVISLRGRTRITC
jgi:type II secretory pathway pseudopilin PulG